MKILIINGPNLNMLGKREPDVYGRQTLDEINRDIAAYAKKLKAEVEFFQSNCEGEIIGRIHCADCPIIINAGAYSHYSYAIADALKCVAVPKIEVHISNIYSRAEEFRHHSVLSACADGVIAGCGADGYKLAILKLSGKIE